MSNILHVHGFESTIPFLKIPFHTLWQVTYPFACYTSTKGPNYISWLTFKRGVYIFVLHACQATLFYKGYFSTNVHICIHIIRALYSKKKITWLPPELSEQAYVGKNLCGDVMAGHFLLPIGALHC